MSKTARKVTNKKALTNGDPIVYRDNKAMQLVIGSWEKMANAAVFSVMRTLKKVNPGDTYYEQYLEKLKKDGDSFFDTYHLLWKIGVELKPKAILEIGTRTGISICQLLSAHGDLDSIERIVCVDPFDQWTSENLVRANLRYLNLPNHQDNVNIFTMKSEDFFNVALKAESRFDYILVDGDHSKAVASADLDSAVKLINKGEIIVFDDISPAPGECALIDVWEAWKSKHEDEFVFHENMTGKGVAWAIKL